MDRASSAQGWSGGAPAFGECNTDDHRWDSEGDEEGFFAPESEAAFEKKLKEWARRDWPAWLSRHLSFPFAVIRDEDVVWFANRC